MDLNEQRKRLIAEETLILDITEAIAEQLETQRGNLHDIAAKADMKERQVRGFIAGDLPSLRFAAAIAHALGMHFEVSLRPGEKWEK